MFIRVGCVALLAVAAAGQGQKGPAASTSSLRVRVLALNFDPRIPQEGNRRLHEVGGWTDPRKLAEGYAADVRESSRGYVEYRIVEWQDIDAFQLKTDGYLYTADEYMKCHKAKKGWHQPDLVDYPKCFDEYKVLPRIDSGEIDEVWFFGAPYFGYYESCMAGPGAFWINGPTYEKVKSKRPFAVMGFNYERGVAEMLHDLCHRTESTMTRVYGGWEVDTLTTHWARFAANEKQSKGVAAAGTCHWPPNAEKDYDYGNKRQVDSSADDWLRYPKLSGKMQKISCEAWGGPDYHRNYMKWWFRHLPHADGVNEDGRLNNWWEYVFNFTQYDAHGKPRASVTRPAEEE